MNSLERDVRRLLRAPKGAAAMSRALGQSLGRAFGTDDVDVALERALSEAVRGYALQRQASLIEAARGVRSGLSDRSFYRAKKRIVERMVDVIGNRLGNTTARLAARANDAMPIALPMVDRLVPERIEPNAYHGPDRGRALSAAALSAEMAGDPARADSLIAQAGNNVRNQFDRRDAACAFEVAQNALYIARCRGDLHGMHAAVRATAKLFERLSSARRFKFSLDCSEVFLYEGRLRDAESELDFATLSASTTDDTLLRSIALVRSAQLGLARREWSVAQAAADSAMTVGRQHADVRVYAADVLGRIALQSGKRWSSQGLEECQSAYHALIVRTMIGRYHVKRGNFDAASESAGGSYDAARKLGYWNLASRAAATLAACCCANDARRWLVEALRLYLNSSKQNAFIGHDLFESVACGAFLASDDAATLAAGVYGNRFGVPACERDIGSALGQIARFIFRGALGMAHSASSIGSGMLLSGGQPMTLQEIERAIRRLGHVTRACAVLLPFDQRAGFVAGNRRQVQRALQSTRQSLARRHWAALRSAR